MNLRSNLKFVAQPKTPLSKRSNKRKECDATSSSSQDGKISYVRYVTELQKLQTDNELLRLQVRELTDEHQSNEPPRKVRFAGPARWKKNVIALTEAESKIRRLEIDNSTLEENINKLRTEHEETVNQLDWMRRQMPSLSRNHSFQDGMLPKKKNNQTDKPNVWRLVIASSESEDSDLLADNDIMPELEVMQFPVSSDEDTHTNKIINVILLNHYSICRKVTIFNITLLDTRHM